MTSTTPEMKRYAAEAGLLPQDMPPANHPLFENDADVRTLGDLVDARTENLRDDVDEGDRDDGSTGKTAYDDIDPEDDYLTREDFVETALLDTDPDENAGDDMSEMLPGAGLDRAPDMTGTVTGIAPGMATHLPLDYGADGFQIVEPEETGDTRSRSRIDISDSDLPSALEDLAATDPFSSALADDETEADGHRIPVQLDQAGSADDALDATRRMH